MKRALAIIVAAAVIMGACAFPYAPDFSGGPDAPRCKPNDVLFVSSANRTAFCLPRAGDCQEDEVWWWIANDVRGCVHIEDVAQ
jgi:hypothetical protein